MPTYDYRCNTCGFEFEVFQSMSETPCEVCPQCDGSVYRVISGGAGVIFKGSGFYKTDSAKGSNTGDTATKTSTSVQKSGGKTEKETSA